MAATLLAGLGARVSAGVLARARLAPAGTAAGGAAAAAAVAGALRRGLASGPADVADRVCAVVKNFEKVPADKVRIPPIELDPGSPPQPPARERRRGGGGGRARAGGGAWAADPDHSPSPALFPLLPPCPPRPQHPAAARAL